MSGIGNINLKVLLLDSDFYALQSINSYLAWDRRTRVTYMAENEAAMWRYIDNSPLAELPDVIVMDADHLGGAKHLGETIDLLKKRITGLKVICLTQFINPELVETAADHGANAYLLKQETRMMIAWAIIYTLDKDFVVTQAIARECSQGHNNRVFHAAVLPERREYPELTERIRQAIRLCVIEGMPAHLAADEMGISLHTIRGYIKEGYRILESYDETEYPVDMTPQERAFMRFTALADEEEDRKDS